MIYGYARVSTKEQNPQWQIDALIDFGVDKIYVDKESGKDFARAEYRKLLRVCKPGDLIVIVAIDRLGRNYNEILEEWWIITKKKEVDIVVLDMPLLDTRQGKDLMGTFIADLVLQILSFVAETERKNIKQRQAEGIAAAKRRGVKFGRPVKEKPEIYVDIEKKYISGEISSRAAAHACNVSQGTFLKWVKQKNKYDTGNVNKKVDFFIQSCS